MDGHFVPNLTMGVDMVRGLRRHFPDVFLDTHLMVERPEEYIDAFADAGSNSFVFHVEVSRPMRPTGVDPAALIDRIHARGMRAGLVVNPPTPLDRLWAIEPFLSELDIVLVMSVNPGRSGQKFMPEVLDKVRWLKPRLAAKTRLEIDGGLNAQTAPRAVAAGVDMIVTASALFGATDRTAAIRAMKGA
jgi:ribulose-phosphate 3-epimerase